VWLILIGIGFGFFFSFERFRVRVGRKDEMGGLCCVVHWVYVSECKGDGV